MDEACAVFSVFLVLLAGALGAAHGEAALPHTSGADMECTEGKTLAESPRGSMACLYPASAKKLESRGWLILEMPASLGIPFTPRPAPIETRPAPQLAPHITDSHTLYHIGASALPHQNEITSAIEQWEILNPDISFERVYTEDGAGLYIYALDESDKDVAAQLGEHAGYYVWPDAELYYVLGKPDCKDHYAFFSPASIRNTIMHELGHHLGLDHTSEREHLMYGSDGVRPELFDELGYTIPRPGDVRVVYALQEAPHRTITVAEPRLAELEESIEEQRGQYEELRIKYAVYPDVIEERAVYSEAITIYHNLEALRAELNRDVEEFNELLRDHNEAVTEFNCYS